jgi:hypothetical protein
MSLQRRIHGENFGATSAMLGRIPPSLVGICRINVSENLGATAVVLVDPVVTSLANGNTKTQSQILISNLVSVD